MDPALQQDPARVSTPIAEDFAAIRARLDAIRAAEHPLAAAPDQDEAGNATPSEPQDFYFWLTGGGLWGADPATAGP
ncbi:hypothetical protein [Paracraurococcus ruber]|uniref:Uncharacterized protein n=1 Tax=Paracraurococcus ruber TaxID=77675 RepID=A0ABS1D0R0_9PROT|nr:hypothetical protein [Paracraurococcus ruber]MBK1660185.1 hypothetical protein [Paracraurococcus ruber]TDG28340.1 hypothetical protein E2C05_20715 [Paracraurococcus ruber]